MADLKLGKLPDKTSVKLSITITQDLQANLQAYALLYAAAYKSEVPVADLIPAMLAAFLDSDKGFARTRKASARVRK